jgi:hypothetical protein
MGPAAIGYAGAKSSRRIRPPGNVEDGVVVSVPGIQSCPHVVDVVTVRRFDTLGRVRRHDQA